MEPNKVTKELFDRLGVRYLSQPEISQTVLNYLPPCNEENPYYQENRAEFIQLTNHYQQALKEGYIAPLTLNFINETVGYGVFSLQETKKGEFIGEYTGVIEFSSEVIAPVESGERHFASDYAWDYPGCFGYEEITLQLNALSASNEMRFVNHSFKPNCDVEHTVIDELWRIFFVANRDIAKGEQFLVSYGEEYWGYGFRELEIL